MGLTSAAVVSLLVVLQLALSTAGQAYQYSIGWTNGRKRAYEGKELQQLPLPYAATPDKDFEEDLLNLKERLPVSWFSQMVPGAVEPKKEHTRESGQPVLIRIPVSKDSKFRKIVNRILWKLDNPEQNQLNF